MAPDLQIFGESKQQAIDAFKCIRTPSHRDRAVQRVNEKADELFAQTLDRTGAKLACQAGCSFCCHIKVDLSAHEVLVIADFVKRKIGGEELGVIAKRASENQELLKPLNVEQQFMTNVPCPLLKDNHCSVYPVRPLACRRHHARSVDPCRKAYEDPTNLASGNTLEPRLAGTMSLFSLGQRKGIKTAGFDSRIYDINAALVEALESDRPNQRWLKGKPAFSDAALAKDYETIKAQWDELDRMFESRNTNEDPE
jgi:hypothetical protein